MKTPLGRVASLRRVLGFAGATRSPASARHSCPPRSTATTCSWSRYPHHTAWDLDDVDQVGRAGCELVAARPERDAWCLGRHGLGSNWYLCDRAGNFVVYYCDLDVIVDDEAWEVAASIAIHPLAAGGPAAPPAFPAPDDIVALGRGSVPSRSRSRSRSQSASSSVGSRPLKARHQFASTARRSGCEYMMHAGLVQCAACA